MPIASDIIDPARLDARILDVYDALTPQQRRLADVVLECGGDIVGHSAASLARKAGVSKATAVRLFKALGYSRFEHARFATARLPWASPLRGLTEDHRESDALSEHIQREIENLNRTCAGLDRVTLQRAVSLLAERRAVWVTGFRISYAISRYMFSVLRNVRPNVRQLTDAAWELAETFAEIDRDEVVVIAAFRRRPPRMARILDILSQRSVPAIVLTDLSMAPHSDSDILQLRCHSRGASIFDSHTMAFSLANYLCSQVGIAHQDRTARHIKSIENLHDAFDDVNIR